MKDKKNNKYFPLIFLIFNSINSIYWISCGIRDLIYADQDYDLATLQNLTQGEIGYLLSIVWVIISIVSNNNENCCKNLIKFFFLFIELVFFGLFYIANKETRFRQIIYPSLLIITNLTLFIPIIMNCFETESFPFVLSFFGVIYYTLILKRIIQYEDPEGIDTFKKIGIIGSITIHVVIIVLYFIMVFKNNEFQKIISNNNNSTIREVTANSNYNKEANFIEKI
jgi:hypothetical protein